MYNKIIYKEIEIDEKLTLILDKIINVLKYEPVNLNFDDYDESITQQHCKKRVSEESLNNILLGYDRNVATADENIIKISSEIIKNLNLSIIFEELIKKECNIKDECSFHMTGKFYYPSNGYMGWHTNNAFPGIRLYCSYAQESEKSFFRFRHPETHEIITSWDKNKWVGRIFYVNPNQPLWHCVYSETDRLSIGCNMRIKYK